MSELISKWLELSKDWTKRELMREMHKAYTNGFLTTEDAQKILRKFDG